MKQIIFMLFIFISLSNNSYSQDTKDIFDQDLSPYVGNWYSSNDKGTLSISLEVTKEFVSSIDCELDFLSGKYLFNNSSSVKFENPSSTEVAIFGGRIITESDKKFLQFSFYDREFKKIGLLRLYIEQDQNQLEWNLIETEKIYINQDQRNKSVRGFSVPQDLKLVRLN